ncbi:MAG: hypothetical protein QNJ97_23250 [Myxococcota bacterium]|nr:hypothetical protein [Myxococcota bacterium]
MTMKNSSKKPYMIVFLYLAALTAILVVGCLEDQWEKIEVEVEGEDCDQDEALRCNGDVIERCRDWDGIYKWRPWEDCSNVIVGDETGECVEPEDGSDPYCVFPEIPDTETATEMDTDTDTDTDTDADAG